MDKYEDLMNMSYTGSKRKNKMALLNRAAQFAPFSALAGYGEAIKETARITTDKIELGESEIEQLDILLQKISDLIDTHPFVQITHFIKDQNKSGGSYQTVCESVKKIDGIKREIILMNNQKIQIENILKIVIEDCEMNFI